MDANSVFTYKKGGHQPVREELMTECAIHDGVVLQSIAGKNLIYYAVSIKRLLLTHFTDYDYLFSDLVYLGTGNDCVA